MSAIVSISPCPILQFFDNNGRPCAGGSVLTQVGGVNTATYQDPQGNTALPNPIPLNSRGEISNAAGISCELFLIAGATYTFTLFDRDGNQLNQAAYVASNALGTTTGAGLVGFDPHLNYVAGTIGEAVEDNVVNFLWFCTESQRTAIKAKTYADDHTALLANVVAFCGGRTVYLPAGGYKISHYTVATAGQGFMGDGWGATIIQCSDPTQHTLTVTAADVKLKNLELQGVANSINIFFAIFTSPSNPAPRMKIEHVKFSGTSAGTGLNNCIKFDTGSDHCRVHDIYVERIYGSTAGAGYCVLTGGVIDCIVTESVFICASGRGRHAVYFSAGSMSCKAIGNYAVGTGFEAFTTFSQGVQPPCEDIVFALNTMIGCCTDGVGVQIGSMSVFGHQRRAKLIGNNISASFGCGIKLDGSTMTDLKDTDIISNTIQNSGFIGIDVIAGVGGKMVGNTVIDSGQAASATYSNIRVDADGSSVGVGTSDWLVSGNRTPNSITATCGFLFGLTAPQQTNINLKGNEFGIGTDGVGVQNDQTVNGGHPIDGYLRFSGLYDPPNIANGAADVHTETVYGAAAGDVVTVTHSSNTDGCAIYGRVSAPNIVSVSILNNSGGAKDIASGTLYIDVYKRTP